MPGMDLLPLPPAPDDALLLVDLQRDFLPGGTLPVPDADAAVLAANDWIARFAAARRPVIATRDWHPPQHGSFTAAGGPWPAHCVAGTAGAFFAPALRLPPDVLIVAKGTVPDRNGYSGFEGTGLARWLKDRGVTRLCVAGVATEYCVQHTVLDARRAGFEVLLLVSAIAAVHDESGRQALARMLDAGVRCWHGPPPAPQDQWPGSASSAAASRRSPSDTSTR